MVLDHSDYDSLVNNAEYGDFLVTLLRQRPTLFLGFSFLDPAIESILELYKTNFGPNFPKLHLAIVPDDKRSGLFSKLAEVNIRTLTYDVSEDHKELWRALRLAFEATKSIQLPLDIAPVLPKDLPPSRVHRVIAFAYARSKTPQAATRPALEMVQDGALLSILDDEPSSYLEKATAVDRLRELLRVDTATATVFLDGSLQRLGTSGDIEVTESYIRRRLKPVFALEQQLQKLSEAVLNRLVVIHGKKVAAVKVEVIARIWEELFMIRAWDLAAQYAGSIYSRGIEIEESVSALSKTYFPHQAAFALTLTEAFLHLITYPEQDEAEALAEISRTAITVNVLFSSTRYSLSHAYTLPTKLYLDASVLLPAVVEGHPLQNGYDAAINKLRTAASRAGLNCELVVGTQFLEEILKHKENAIELVRQANLETPEALVNHILFYGACHTNVFVGAFSARQITFEKTKLSFSDFLKTAAPYQNQQELIVFLKERGIKAEEMDFSRKNNVEFTHIFSNLQLGYERQIRRTKEKVLIQPEAQQLTRLFVDLSSGKRSVFVTADTRLQRLVQGSEHLEKLTGNVLSQIGFVGLVDLLVGLAPDREVFTRLIWACPRNDVQKHVRDYLVAVTLRQYDDAMTRAMPEVLDEVVDAAQKEISDFGRDYGEAADPNDVKETTKFLDRLENQYFEKMRRAVEANARK